MEELFNALHHVSVGSDAAQGRILLDTCFLLYQAEHHHLELLFGAPVAVTSFNVAELVRVAHRLGGGVKATLRHFLKSHPALLIVDVPVVPGDWAGEHAFVERVAPGLLSLVADPSDGVLAAAALATGSDVLTRDKHHLFTTTLEDFFTARGLHVWKEWKDVVVSR